VDPPLKNPFAILHDNLQHGKRVAGVHSWRPYGGGYVDFARLGKESKYLSYNRLYRAPGLRGDLETRLRGDFSIFLSSHTDAVDSISSLLQKILLSNWMLTIAVLQRDFYSLQLGVLAKDSTRAENAGHILDDLVSSRNLLDKCNRMVRKSAYQLGINPTQDTYLTSWRINGLSERELLFCDWTFLIQELKTFTEDTERLVSNHFSKLEILSSKLAQDETKAFNTLTTLGQFVVLIFTPLGCAYGILSIGGDFAPGNRKFWIFFALAIPLVILTVMCFFLALRMITLREERQKQRQRDQEKQDVGHIETDRYGFRSRDGRSFS
jgi:hypothetical protein